MFVSTHGILAKTSLCAAITGTTTQYGVSSGTDSRYPAYGLYNYSHQMFLFTQAEIGSAKQITGIQFYMSGYTGGYTMTNQTLKIYHTTDAIFGTSVQITNTNGDVSGINQTDLTTCRSGFTWTPVNNTWNTVTFTTNFCYDGIKNLVIQWESRDGSWTSGYGTAQVNNPVTFKTWYKELDASYPTGFGTRNSASRPNIRLIY